MAVYSVLEPPAESGLSVELAAEFIPDTLAWKALVLPLPWLLWHRLWWASLFYVLVSIALAVALATEISTLALILTLFPGLYLLLEGNELRRKNLLQKSWNTIALVEGEDIESAEARFFHLHARNLPTKNNRTADTRFKNLVPRDEGVELFASSEGE